MNAAVQKTEVNEKQPNKTARALEIVRAGFKDKAKPKDIITKIREECDMSPAGASTYYYNAKRKIEAPANENEAAADAQQAPPSDAKAQAAERRRQKRAERRAHTQAAGRARK